MNVSDVYRSKALAVASSKGSFGIMSLKDIDDLQGEIDRWDPRDPTSLRPFKEVCLL